MCAKKRTLLPAVRARRKLMNPSSRFPLLLTLLCCAVLALPAWATDASTAPAAPTAPAASAALFTFGATGATSGQCGAAAQLNQSTAPHLVPAGPQDVPFTDYSPDDHPVGRVFASWIGDCCTGGASLCACVNGYLRHCGSPQCDTGTYSSCLYLPCSTCHC